ncbi:MAG: hypothetical protein ABSA03_00585 [Streptosporangiaceae bacterium]
MDPEGSVETRTVTIDSVIGGRGVAGTKAADQRLGTAAEKTS